MVFTGRYGGLTGKFPPFNLGTKFPAVEVDEVPVLARKIWEVSSTSQKAGPENHGKSQGNLIV
jgi:hypothetical protein